MELGHPSFEAIFADSFDNRIIKFTCSRGHDCHTLIQSQKFELLLDSGASALNSGYTLEAVGAYAAARERFFEFSMAVIARHLNISEQALTKINSNLITQSERQLGAFLFAYSLISSDPFHVDNNISSFRNKVIHRGYIPTVEEAIFFCSSVYSEILHILKKLEETCDSSIRETIRLDMLARRKTLPTTDTISTVANNGILSLSHRDRHESFSESYSAYIKWLGSRDQLTTGMSALFNFFKRLMPN